MKKVIVGLVTLTSMTTFAGELCLNQVGNAAYKYTLQNMQTSFEKVYPSISSAVSSIKYKGGLMNDTIYEVKLSGRQVTSSGMITGPASFTVEVYVNNANCQVSRANH